MNEAALKGLKLAAEQRSDEARTRINDAIKALRRENKPISKRAVAARAKVDRTTIYNHPDLREKIEAAAAAPRPKPVPEPDSTRTGDNAVIDALRHQIRITDREHQNTLRALRTELADTKKALAVAHGEIHRLTQAQRSHRRT